MFWVGSFFGNSQPMTCFAHFFRYTHKAKPVWPGWQQVVSVVRKVAVVIIIMHAHLYVVISSYKYTDACFVCSYEVELHSSNEHFFV